MIYFDNAASTARKPAAVAEAVVRALGSFGGVGRGVHEASLDAGSAVFHARQQVAGLFGAGDPSQVAFMSNATEALNTAIAGLLRPGDRAVTTAASHNSVLRPLYRKEQEEGCELSIVSIAPDGSLDYAEFEEELRKGARLAAVAHASNLSGDVYDIARIARLCRRHHALLLVDAAQTAGVVPIDMQADGIDLVAFTGHKSLFGPQGTGGLVVSEGIEVAPLKVGGSGVRSFEHIHPRAMPERLEAGTLNAHGIAGLSAGLAYIESRGVREIGEQDRSLAQRFERGVRALAGVRVLGGGADAGRCGIVALNVGDVDSGTVGDLLNTEHGVCVRAGAHCAPLMHRAFGTQEQGAVRFSFSCLNTADEVDAGVEAVRVVVEELC